MDADHSLHGDFRLGDWRVLEVRNLLQLADRDHPLLTRVSNLIQPRPRADLKPVSAR